MSNSNLRSSGFKTTLNTRPKTNYTRTEHNCNTNAEGHRRSNGKEKSNGNKKKAAKAAQHETEERKSATSLTKSERTLNIVSLNPDAMTKEFLIDCEQRMLKKLIHVAIIQETKRFRNCDYRTRDGARVIATAAEKGLNNNPIGGVAILLSKDLAGMVKDITRHNSRVLQVTLQANSKDLAVNLFAIYAPRNGYVVGQRSEFWKQLRHIYKNTTRKGVVITGIDANGQLGAANNGERHKKTVGIWTNATKTEAGNGTHFRNFCTKNRMIPMNTWKEQSLTKDNTQYVTWTHPNKVVKRQISTWACR